jgi:predicted ATPase with chaperone activity
MIKEDAKVDRRWVLCRRPAVVLGAELDRETLDVAYDPQSRFYQAPPHIKAQGGVLIVDDFGRQKVDPRDLLTRWLIPLERGWDTLTLATGEKVTVPFSMQLFFGTNLKIRDLADEALLRRILYKVHVPNPTPGEFSEILRQLCRQRRVLVKDGALDYVAERLYSSPDLRPRASYARDILDMIVESAGYDGRDPVLDNETFDKVFALFHSHESGEDDSIVDDDI